LYGSIYSISLLFFSEHFHGVELSRAHLNSALVSLYRFLSSKWGFDAVYNRIVNQPLLKGAYNITFSLIDKGVLEVIGPTGGGLLTYRAGTQLVRAQTGRVYDYAAFMLFSVLLTTLGVDYSYLFASLAEDFIPFSTFVTSSLLPAVTLCSTLHTPRWNTKSGSQIQTLKLNGHYGSVSGIARYRKHLIRCLPWVVRTRITIGCITRLKSPLSLPK
jgi:hypothetical protein